MSAIRPHRSWTQISTNPGHCRHHRRLLGDCIENESDAIDRSDHRGLLRSIDLTAQVPDMNIDDIAAWRETIAPDILEQLGSGHNPTRATHHVFEQLEFPREQLDITRAASDSAFD